MVRTIKPQPLTADAFAPYGEVIEASPDAEMIRINEGNTTRFHDLFPVDVSAGGGEVCVSIFRSNPLPKPVTLKLMEYHPLGSQAFMPLGREPYLVVVAKAGSFDADKIKVFLAQPWQGVNYRKGTWHHYSLALNAASDFLVIDRKGAGDNCVEYTLDASEQVAIEL